MFLVYNHFYRYSQFLNSQYNSRIMTVDQNSFDSIILDMYSSLLVFMTYSKPVDLGAHNISINIHFSINALMLGLVNFIMSRN